MDMMERWYQAVDKRCSIRKYKNGLKDSALDDLQTFADSISMRGTRIAIAAADDVFAQKIGSTKIKGTDCFAVIISKEGKSISAGYMGEMFALECVARDYGTCWVGSSYRQKLVQECVNLDKNEKIAAIIAFGIAAEPIVTRKRYPIPKLADMSIEEFSKLPMWQQSAIECARRAPSAGNAQPWGFELPTTGNKNSICVYDVSKNMGFYQIDLGICMLHIELGARHYGTSGDWSESDAGFTFNPIIAEPVHSTAVNYDELLWPDSDI